MDNRSANSLIADALIHVQCAHTSLERWREFGLLDRERPWFERVAPRFGRAVMMTYGGGEEQALAESLVPAAVRSRVACVSNTMSGGEEPARFQAGVPARVLADVRKAGARSAVVWTDQHYGGEVGLAIARELRGAGIRTGLVARGGYHWSWFTARDHGMDSAQAVRAAAVEGELCRGADVAVGSTRRMVEDLCWRHALGAGKVRLIPNFVDVPANGLVVERDPNLVLGAGRLEPQKRFDLLIRAVGLLSRSHPAARLRLYGDGSLRESLAALAREVGASVEIRPRVAQRELLEEIRRCAVFAQTSAFEGHPKTIIEAMASGAAVVVTRGPGVDEEVVSGVTGLVTREEPGAVAAAIGALVDTPAGARHMGEAAAADIRKRLSLDAVVPMVDAACRDALALNGAGASMPSGAVRWDQMLLNAAPEDAAREFGGAIGAYAKRLSAEEQGAFAHALSTRMPQSHDVAIVPRR